jgi:hypothetical protein
VRRRSAAARSDHPGNWRVDIDPISRDRTIHLPNGIVRRYDEETIAAMALDVLVLEQLDPSRLSAETYALVRQLAGEEDWQEAKLIVRRLVETETHA